MLAGFVILGAGTTPGVLRVLTEMMPTTLSPSIVARADNIYIYIYIHIYIYIYINATSVIHISWNYPNPERMTK